jgi:hypothetical protein
MLQATAGTEGARGHQPLSARDTDMGLGTRRMLAIAAIVRFVCRRHGEGLTLTRSELLHQISFGTAASRMRLDDLGGAPDAVLDLGSSAR